MAMPFLNGLDVRALSKFESIGQTIQASPTFASNVLTLDMSHFNNFGPLSINANITTWTMSNVPAGMSSFTFLMKGDGTARAITYPGSFVWVNAGSAPTYNSVLNAISILTGFSPDGGTTWYVWMQNSNNGGIILSGGFNATFILSAAVSITLPGTAGTMATLARTETFTNKFLSPGPNYVGAIGGSATAYTVTTGFSIAALVDGLTIIGKIGTANTGTTTTLAPDGLTATVIKKKQGTAAIAAADMAVGSICSFTYRSSIPCWVLNNPLVP